MFLYDFIIKIISIFVFFFSRDNDFEGKNFFLKLFYTYLKTV